MTLPSNLPGLEYFFTRERTENLNYDAALASATNIFADIKNDLLKIYADVFRQRHVSFNLIDTDYKYNSANVQAELFDELMGRGFQLCTQGFRGRYILFNMFIQEYSNHGTYHYPDLQESLLHKPMAFPTSTKSRDTPDRHTLANFNKPSSTKRRHDRKLLHQNISVVFDNKPVIWKGPLESSDSTELGPVSMYSLCKDNSRIDPLAFFYCLNIEIQSLIDLSQFDSSWLFYDDHSSNFENNFIMSVDFDYGNGHFFINYLASLSTNHQVAIAKQVLLEGAEEIPRFMCIEPMTRGRAVVRFLNILALPEKESLKVAYERDMMNSVVEKMTRARLDEIIQAGTHGSKKRMLPLNVTPSDSVKASILEYKRKNEKGNVEDVKSKEIEDEKEDIVELPEDIPAFNEKLRNLYYEALYERGHFFEVFLSIVDRFINHLVDNKKIDFEEIIKVIKSIACTRETLEAKHELKIKNAKQWKTPLTTAKEDEFVYEWWERAKEQSPELESENECRLLLKVTDARINAIFYCFLGSLLRKCSPEDKDIQTYLNYAVEHYETPHYYINALDIAQRTDEEVDDVDKSEYNFLKLLESRFKENIPELIEELYESFYEEDIVPNQFMAGVNPAEIFKNYNKKKTEKPKMSDLSLSEMLEQEKLAKIKKVPIESRYKTMPALPERKRGDISEAARDAIDKVKRTMVDGKPTMKRVGAFLVSATSPKKKRREMPKEALTPRTSLSRILGSNIFEDYAKGSLSDEDDFGLGDLIEK
ncbi:unnamed protein product [Rhizopus stolonifer]